MKRFPWHILWIALFPVVFLYAENTSVVEIKDVWLPLIYSIVGASVVLGICYLVFRDLRKAAVMASLLVLLFFSYGAYHEALFPKRILTFIGKGIRFDHNFYKWTSLFLILLIGWRLFKLKKDIPKFTSLLNMITFVLFGFSAFNVIQAKAKGPSSKATHSVEEISVQLDSNAEYPSIYYIILDAYGREDVLREMYDFDNSPFTDFLKDRGFFVADGATSNYGQTILSVPSALNMNYLDSMAEVYGEDYTEREPLMHYLRENKTLHFLESLGYESVAYDASIFGLAHLNTADHFFETPGTDINLFMNELINTTAIRAFNGRKPIKTLDNVEHHRKKINAAFDHMERIASKPGPLYVHGHVLTPHQPFVFNADGSRRDMDYEYTIWAPMESLKMNEEEYKDGYLNQLQYVNTRVMQLVDTILQNSVRKPVIILQGDHGPASELHNINGFENNDFRERLSILNAYYFPDGDYSMLSDTVTPINSFRVVRNKFFGGNYELLPDRAYYSNWNYPYHFYDVTDSIR